MATPSQIAQFEKDGYVIFENFLDEKTIEELKVECSNLVEKMDPAEHNTIFSTVDQNQIRDTYFMESGDKLAYFFEPGALDKDGVLQVDKHKSLNKIGHALHALCPGFRKVTYSARMKALIKSLGYVDPVVAQSMYIFKQPHIGGVVVPHQDGSYLYTDPIKVMGVWFALEDAVQENGCLEFVPGSHKAVIISDIEVMSVSAKWGQWVQRGANGLRDNYRMLRSDKPDGPRCIYEVQQPKFEDLTFIPAPVKKGTMVAIDGLVVHQSAPNLSEKSRHAYVFHLYDHHTSVWSDRNWLQPTDANTYIHLLDTEP